MALAPIPPKGEKLEDQSVRSYMEDLRLNLESTISNSDDAVEAIEDLENALATLTVGELADVSFTDLLGGDLLLYDSNAQTWINQQLELNSLTDVSLGVEADLLDGDVLIYDEATTQWINSTTSFVTPFTIEGTSSGPAEIRLSEDTDTGTNYVGWKSPSSVTTNKVYELTATDGSSGDALTTNGSGVTSWADVTTTAATPAEMEAETVTTAMVTPENIIHSQRVAKVCWYYKQVSAATINYSYGVSSITDSSTGVYVVNFSTDFTSTTSYSVITTHIFNTFFGHAMPQLSSYAAGSVQVKVYGHTGSTFDEYSNGAIFGDQ